MGNSQLDSSTSKLKLQYSIENDLLFLKKITDDRYGEIKVMQIKDSKPREFVALKTILASTARDCEENYEQLAIRKKLDLPTIVRIKAIDKTEMDQYCSHYYKIYVLYEYYDRTLKSEIEKREGKEHFEEFEIYRLIDCVLSALILFSNNNIIHSDIRPYTIFLSEDGVYKLNDIQFMSGLNAYTQFLMGNPDYDNCFLSPELFEQLGHRILQPTQRNHQKSDVFSLGMTALEAATLKPIYHCYDFDEFKLKEEVIMEHLEEVKEKYSEKLYILLKNMLRIDANVRFDYTNVFQSLSQIKEFNKESLPLEENSIIKEEKNNEEKINEKKFKEEKPKQKLYLPDKESSTKADRTLYYDLNLLEERIKETLMRSEEAQKKFIATQKMRGELLKDEYYDFVAKREEVVRKSAQARESITQERKKKTLGIDERDLLNSNKLYEMYLEEYENLRNKEYS